MEAPRLLLLLLPPTLSSSLARDEAAERKERSGIWFPAWEMCFFAFFVTAVFVWYMYTTVSERRGTKEVNFGRNGSFQQKRNTARDAIERILDFF